MFTAIRITYALNIFEAHGITSFLKFCDRTKAKKGVGIKDLFEKDPNFMRAIELANFAQGENSLKSFHCFPFGGFEKTCLWLNAVQSGEFTIDNSKIVLHKKIF